MPDSNKTPEQLAQERTEILRQLQQAEQEYRDSVALLQSQNIPITPQMVERAKHLDV